MANEAMETLLQKMSELTTAIKDSKQPKQELQWDDVQAQFGEQLKGLVAAQVKEKLDAQPNYRTPGAEVGAGGLPQIKASNRYGRMVKGLQKDGFHRIGNQKAKPVDLWLAGQMLQKANAMMPDRVNSPSEDLSEAIKALTSTGSGTGAELVDRQMAEMLWDDIFMSSRVVGAMANVPMPSNPFDLPLGLGSIRFRKGTQGVAVTGTNPATAKSTLTATEQEAMVEWSYTLDEDAVVALMPEIRARLAQAGGEAIDGFALNADNTNAATGNINTDDAAPAADDYFLSDGQDGLRHLWLVDNTAQGVTGSAAALTDAMITSTLKTMGKYAAEMAVFELVDREIIDRKKKVKKVDDSAAAEGTAVTSDPFKGVRKMFGGKKKETTAKAGKATATKSVKPAKTTTSNRKVSASGGKSGSSST
jgi:HK97 family phage major capsid protein